MVVVVVAVVVAVAVVVVGVEAVVLLQDGYLKLEIVTAVESGKCLHLDLEHGSGLGQGQDFEFGCGYGHGFENSAAPQWYEHGCVVSGEFSERSSLDRCHTETASHLCVSACAC